MTILKNDNKIHNILKKILKYTILLCCILFMYKNNLQTVLKYSVVFYTKNCVHLCICDLFHFLLSVTH